VIGFAARSTSVRTAVTIGCGCVRKVSRPARASCAIADRRRIKLPMWMTLEQTFTVPASREAAFDLTVDPELFTDFKGYGPIPGIVGVSARNPGATARGSVFDVHNSDGSTHVEEITWFERPERSVRQIREFSSPFRFLVRRVEEEWVLSQVPEGCRAWRAFRFELRSALLYPVARLLALAFERAMRDHARIVSARLAATSP